MDGYTKKIMDENLDNIEDVVSLSQYRFSPRNGARISVLGSRTRMKKPRPILEKSREFRYRYRSRLDQLQYTPLKIDFFGRNGEV